MLVSISMNYTNPPDKQRYNEQVWTFARLIPRGKVATYGQIAKSIVQPDGISAEDYRTSAARWVGMAMSACPDDVPWQRVVNSQGRISHKAQPGQQQKLLEEEGVLFSGDKIDLGVFQWRGNSTEAVPEQGSLF